MSDPAMQAKAQALNAKMEGEARIILDDIERTVLRKKAKESYQCVVTCFDKAGTTGPSEVLEQCARNCQVPYQRANQYVQEETAQFQNRLSRAMMDCQDEARDMMTPGMEKNPSKMQKVEDSLLKCMTKAVDQHIALLQPMKKRIVQQLK